MRTFIMLAVCLLAVLMLAWVASPDLKPSKLSATVAPSVVTPASHDAQTASQKSNFQDGAHAWLAGHSTAAFAILKPLATQGNAVAQYLLGLMYAHGQGVPRDYAQARAWYRKAAAQGEAEAQLDLGWMYAHGQGVPRDYARARAWYRKAAAQGEAVAQTSLGLMYGYGQGVPRDWAQARAWWSKAAAQGEAPGEPAAQYRFGWAYVYGQGVPRDYAQALAWYRKAEAQGEAANQELAEAQYLLGWMYANGRGVPRDYVAAYALFKLSTSLDGSVDNRAALIRNRLMDLMTPEQVTAGQALAVKMWRIGAIKALDEYLNDGAQ